MRDYHTFSVEQTTICIKIHEQQISSLDKQLQLQNVATAEIRRKKDEAERKGVLSIAVTVILCGRQNIPLRGHRDTVNLDVDVKPQEGNFKSFLWYRVRGGDTALEKYVRTVPANALHTSSNAQNELIDICRGVIISHIMKRVCQ